MLTASSIERGKMCPGHTTLPHRDVPTEDAEAGSERHGVREVAINAGNIPEVLETRWPGLKWRAEVKFAYDLSTGKGRILGYGSDRDYSAAGPFEVVGTADCVGIDREWLDIAEGVSISTGITKLVIVDWKSFKLVARAVNNLQLRIAALALGRALGCSEADVAIHYETRPMDVAELDTFEIDAFATEIRAILDEAARYRQLAKAGEAVSFTVGSWCAHCPGFYDCPKQKELEVQIERHPALVAADKATLPFADDEDAATAYEFAERVRTLSKKLDTALYARASSRPIPLRNGKMFGPREKLGNRELDGNKAYELVREKYGQNIADLAVAREASQTSIESAMKFAGVKSVKGAKDELMTELDKRGGVSRKKKTVIEEYDAQQPQLKAANQ